MASRMPDELLARRAVAGDLNGFEELVSRYRKRVYGICYRMAGNAEDAEDWAQECFLRIYRQLRHYEPTRPFQPWALRVAANMCLNLGRSKMRRQRKMEVALTEVDGTLDESDPVRFVISREQERHVRLAVETLSPLVKQAVVLRVMEDLSFRELAEVLGVPLQTAASRVRRGLDQVRTQLAGRRIEVDL